MPLCYSVDLSPPHDPLKDQQGDQAQREKPEDGPFGPFPQGTIFLALCSLRGDLALLLPLRMPLHLAARVLLLNALGIGTQDDLSGSPAESLAEREADGVLGGIDQQFVGTLGGILQHALPGGTQVLLLPGLLFLTQAMHLKASRAYRMSAFAGGQGQEDAQAEEPNQFSRFHRFRFKSSSGAGSMI